MPIQVAFLSIDRRKVEGAFVNQSVGAESDVLGMEDLDCVNIQENRYSHKPWKILEDLLYQHVPTFYILVK